MIFRLRKARTRTRLAAAMLLGATAIGVCPSLSVGAAAAAETAPAARTGVYRGAGAWGAQKVPAYESFAGRPVDYALDFQSTDTWGNQEWPDWQASAWRGRTVVLGATGIFPGNWDRTYAGTTVGWAQAARGDYDAHWLALAQRLVATGQQSAVLRGAHEFNGGWFAHRVHPEEAADFVKAWQRWVGVMRSVPGQSFVFDWNPTVGTEWPLYSPEVAYPGDAYVDHIALDVYDGWYNQGWAPGSAQPTAAQRDAVWDTTLNGTRGLRFWHQFALNHNKHLSFPEWGLRLWTEGDGLVHGGGDDAAFVQRMAALIKDPTWQVDYQAFWEDKDKGVSDPDGTRAVSVPGARSAYLAAFGGSSTTVPSTPVTSAPAPAPSPVATATPAPAPVVTTSPSPTPAPTAPVTSISCVGAAVAATSTRLPLSYSRWSDRSWASELTGASVSGNVFAFTPSTGLRAVSYQLDARPVRVDGTAPFDLVDGNVWWASALDTTTLKAGQHTVAMVAQRTDGTCMKRTATFRTA